MNKRHLLLGLAIVAIVGAIVYLEGQKPPRANVPVQEIQSAASDRAKAKEGRYPRAVEIAAPTGFINAPDSFKIADLIGKKVVLVDFWTYSCINCQRTTPYLNAWYDKYRNQGLEIVGIHTPEFDFEKVYANVAAAVEKFGIRYPVIMDSDYGTWGAYKNRYWPHKFLIDIDGYVVYDHIGEGGYEETEKKIQELLGERMTALGESGKIATDMVTPQAEAAPAQAVSPEIYFGSARNEYFVEGPAPESPALNDLYLEGDWDLTEEYAHNSSPNASVVFRYRAAKVFMVASSEKPITVQILKDGKPYREVTIKDDQLYRLIEDDAVDEHTLEIKIPQSGLKTFTFTFG